MATDYDSPRKTDDDLSEDSLQELQARRMDKSSSTIDLDPDDAAEGLELPGADLSNEELSFRVIPRQADEFTCSRCFLVHHRSQLAEETKRPADLPRVRRLAKPAPAGAMPSGPVTPASADDSRAAGLDSPRRQARSAGTSRTGWLAGLASR